MAPVRCDATKLRSRRAPRPGAAAPARFGTISEFAPMGAPAASDQALPLRPNLRTQEGLPSFPASDKRKDPRYDWFRSKDGNHCWKLDAMDPNDLRDCVKEEIENLIEPIAWARCDAVNRAEQASLRDILKGWRANA
jgi:hypothetical protein